MKRPIIWWVVSVFGSYILCASRCDGKEEEHQMEVKHEKEVFVMTSNNFHHLVQGHETGLVLFHVPWDTKFRAMLPDFEKAAKKVAEELPSVLIGKLDVSLFPDIAAEFDIRGDEAQLIYFHQSKPYNFVEYKSSSALLATLRERSATIWNPPRPHPELVPELSQHEFKKTVEKLDFAVVSFYRSSCPSCVRLLVEYETAVVNLTEKISDKVRFFKTNLDDAAELSQEYDIKEVPAMKIFRKGKAFDYSSREKLFLGILQYINRQLQAPYKAFKTIEEAEGWIRSYPNKPAILGIFTSEKHPNMETFLEVANHFRDELNIAFVKSKSSTGDWQILAYPPFRHVSPADKKKSVFSDKPEFDKLVAFIKKATKPLVGHRTARNKDTVYSSRPLLIGYLDVDWSKAREDDTRFHRDKISQMVHGFPDITFCISDKKEFKHELLRMNLDKHQEEVLIGIIGNNGEYYAGPVVEIMNLKILTDFADGYKKNKLKPFFRTQSPPTHDDSEDYPVKVVVGATFRKLILRHDKEVLLLLHRPSCPACKKAMAIVHDLAEQKEYPNLVYATMDTLANDAPARFSTNSTYPMMYFVSYDKTVHPIPYPTREFTRDKITEFIHNNAHKHKVRTEL